MKAVFPKLSAICLLCAASFTQAETLEQIYELAIQNDAQRKADYAAYLAGKENYKIGLAGLLPTVTGSASYTDRESDSDGTRANILTDLSEPFISNDASTSTAWGATLRQPLFNMGSWYGYKQGKIGKESAEVTYAASEQTFLIRVATVYFEVLRAIDNLKTAIAEERAIGSQLEQTKQRYEVGLTAITDVHEAQAAFDSATANKLQAEGQLGIAFEALEVITGVSPNSVAPVTEALPVTNPSPLARQEWVDFALANNYTLKAAKLNADNQEYTAKTSKSGHLPTVAGSVTYNNSDSDTTSGDSLPDSVTETTTFVISVDVPIFAGGATSARSRQAYQRYVQAKEQYNNTYRNTIQSARSLHLLVETAVATVAARRQAIVSSQSALEATQAGYEVGTRTLVDLLLAQRSLYTAQRNYYDSLYTYIVNTLRLKEAAGTLTPQDILELNQYLDAVNQVSRDNVTP